MGLQRRGALSARHTAELVDEIAPLVRGARVRDVQSLPPRDLLLALEKDQELLRLRLSADANAPRLNLVGERVPAHRGPLGPFFRTLAQELPGARVADLTQVEGDRLVRLDLVLPDGDVALVLELVGRHANMMLLDSDGVSALLVPPPARAGEQPRLRLGQPWRPPPGSPPPDPGAPLAQALPLEPEPDLGATPCSRRVELTLGAFATALRRESAEKSLLGRLKRRRKTLERTLAGLGQRRAAGEQAELIRRDGELLKGVLAEVRRGMAQVEVDDWFDPEAPRRTIELEPALAPAENVARIFKRARKLEADAATVDEDERGARAALERIAALQERALDPTLDPEELDRSAVAEGLLAPRQSADTRRTKAPAARLPYRTYRADSGATILVGRSARDNDELSLKVARGSDLWLHTADAPGSHVVLRLARGADPGEEDVLDAAHLALHFSPLRGAPRADIHVARCKEVKKPKRAPAGLVTLSGGRTLRLRVETQRLRRLLDLRDRS